MVEQYSQEEFSSFIKSMKKISDVLRSSKPNYIFAPILGSIPLIDILNIIDRNFPLDNVEYPPNSSRFENREELISKWYGNFLKSNYFGERMSIICVDEVISGSSASKGYKEFRKALKDFGEKKNSRLEKQVTYNLLGIGEKTKNRKRNPNFTNLVNKKKAQVFESDKIITADNILLNPVRLRGGGFNVQGRNIYLPEIKEFVYSDDYLNLLSNIALFCGADPEQVQPLNILKVRDSLEKYLK